MIHLIDLKFQGIDHAIGAYLVESDDGPFLIETGPYSTFDHLKQGLKSVGYQPEDIRHVFLTHIHLDHAGAAWAFAELGASIYLHPFGSSNMADPSRLMASATRIYGDEMDRLWGTMQKIPAAQLVSVADKEEIKVGSQKIIAHHTPGHAVHHIAWQLGEDIFTGDVAGVKVNGGPVVAPCPPPDIQIEDWKTSIGRLQELKPKNLYLTHFGKVDEVENHLRHLEEMLDDWAQWMKKKWEAGLTREEITPLFMEYTAAQLRDQGVDEEGIKVYEAANPSWMSVAGLIRYWKKKSEAS